MADDGVTTLDILWAGPAEAAVPPAPTATTYDNRPSASIPRTVVNQAFTSLATQPQTVPSTIRWSIPVPGTDNAGGNNTQQSSSYYVQGKSRVDNIGDSGLNYTTQQYGSPSPSHVSAHASATTISGGSPWPQKDPQAHEGYPFNSLQQSQFQHTTPDGATGQPSQYPGPRRHVTSLPPDVQSTIHSLDRRYIQTNLNESFAQEQLDARYRRVAQPSRATFFVLGRVFKMLWTEPAGQMNPGKTRNSTHFSTVQYGETAFSEIRRFVVVRNKGEFSQCIPIQTYRGRGAAKPGVRMGDHGIIHTTVAAPNQLPGEALTKYSIQVQSTEGEYLELESRVNYGKAYAVEHNVKVLDVGMVIQDHRYLIKEYFDAAMQAE